MKSSVVRIGLVPHGFEVSTKLSDDNDKLHDEAWVCRDFSGTINPYLLGLYLFDLICPILNDEKKLLAALEKFKKEKGG